VTGNFTYEARRSDGMNIGHRETFGDWLAMASTCDVGTGDPQMSMPEVIPVCGDQIGSGRRDNRPRRCNLTERIVCYLLGRG
jgi:hypothetical protein